jgi:hypothetical protein
VGDVAVSSDAWFTQDRVIGNDATILISPEGSPYVLRMLTGTGAEVLQPAVGSQILVGQELMYQTPDSKAEPISLGAYTYFSVPDGVYRAVPSMCEAEVSFGALTEENPQLTAFGGDLIFKIGKQILSWNPSDDIVKSVGYDAH